MNSSHKVDADQYKSLQILDELSRNDSLTQRDLSSSLGIALGLVNSYIKNLISKGYITVKAIPPKRYGYYLTPKGFTEKTRLTYHMLQDYTRVYREARTSLKLLFQELEKKEINNIVFAGADEVAEIAYLTLQETNLILSGVADNELAGAIFFGRNILSVENIKDLRYDCIVVTSYLKRDRIYRELLHQKIDKTFIRTIAVV